MGPVRMTRAFMSRITSRRSEGGISLSKLQGDCKEISRRLQGDCEGEISLTKLQRFHSKSSRAVRKGDSHEAAAIDSRGASTKQLLSSTKQLLSIHAEQA